MNAQGPVLKQILMGLVYHLGEERVNIGHRRVYISIDEVNLKDVFYVVVVVYLFIIKK
jgi:hypothetical protein